MSFQIKRIYEAASPDDGYRVLVDRLWPRGVSKEKAALDEWLKDVAPSAELRTWFDHKEERFAEFSTKYQAELAKNPAVKHLQELAAHHKIVTLLYSAHDPRLNQARVLCDYLQS